MNQQGKMQIIAQQPCQPYSKLKLQKLLNSIYIYIYINGCKIRLTCSLTIWYPYVAVVGIAATIGRPFTINLGALSFTSFTRTIILTSLGAEIRNKIIQPETHDQIHIKFTCNF